MAWTPRPRSDERCCLTDFAGKGKGRARKTEHHQEGGSSIRTAGCQIDRVPLVSRINAFPRWSDQIDGEFPKQGCVDRGDRINCIDCSKSSGPTMLVLSVGLLSSASTWVENVARSLLSAADATPSIKRFADSLGGLDDVDLTGCRHLVLKSHHPAYDLVLLSATGAAKTILTIRDPRDCIASLMQRFGRSFEQSFRDTSSSMAHIEALALDNVLVLRYENRFFEFAETIETIATFLGTPCPKELRESLLQNFGEAAVRAFVKTITTERGDEVNRLVDSLVDKATGFHTNHITDTRSGKYREILTDRQIGFVEAVMARSLERQGYGGRRQPIDPDFFSTTNAAIRCEDEIAIPAGPEGACAVFGPYIDLPKGDWVAEFLTATDCAVDIAVSGERIAAGRSSARLPFKVTTLGHPIEFRVYSAACDNRFKGVLLN